MPIFLLAIGVLFVVVGVNNKMAELGALIREDFSPSKPNVPGFQVWILAIFAAGAIGYVKTLRPIANAFLVLIIVTMLLSNKGFATQLAAAFKGK